MAFTDPTNNLTFEVSDGMAFYTTACCGASGKGSSDSESGVVCRACYHDVDSIYGTGPTADVLAQVPGVPAEAVDKARAGREFELRIMRRALAR